MLEAEAEGVAAPQRFDLGARLALRFGKPPVALMLQPGRPAVECVLQPLLDTPGAEMPVAGLDRMFS